MLFPGIRYSFIRMKWQMMRTTDSIAFDFFCFFFSFFVSSFFAMSHIPADLSIEFETFNFLHFFSVLVYVNVSKWMLDVWKVLSIYILNKNSYFFVVFYLFLYFFPSRKNKNEHNNKTFIWKSYFQQPDRICRKKKNQNLSFAFWKCSHNVTIIAEIHQINDIKMQTMSKDAEKKKHIKRTNDGLNRSFFLFCSKPFLFFQFWFALRSAHHKHIHTSLIRSFIYMKNPFDDVQQEKKINRNHQNIGEFFWFFFLHLPYSFLIFSEIGQIMLE